MAAEFASMWHHDNSELWDCALYITLSMASQELLPLCHLVLELHTHGLFLVPLQYPYYITHTSTLETSTIYEDNASCIALAHSEGTKQCTRDISIKWHCFHDHIKYGVLRQTWFQSQLGRYPHEASCCPKTWNLAMSHHRLVFFSLSKGFSSHEGGLTDKDSRNIQDATRSLKTRIQNLPHKGVSGNIGTGPAVLACPLESDESMSPLCLRDKNIVYSFYNSAENLFTLTVGQTSNFNLFKSHLNVF